MTGEASAGIGDPRVAIALNYASAAARPALAALFALDTALGQVVRTTSQPLIGQMRLTWWHERLSALGEEVPPAEPVLRALAAHVLPRGVLGDVLAALVEGWEPLLDAPPLTATMIEAHAAKRGAALFALAGQLLGGASDAAAGRGWALVDLAAHWSNATEAEQALGIARQTMRTIAARQPKALRVLTTLTRYRAARPLARLGEPPSRRALLSAILR